MADGAGFITRIVVDPQWELRNSQSVVYVLKDLSSPARLLALQERQANRPEQVNNSLLRAGSPMYYYCKCCGHLAAVMDELHREAVPKFCPECKSLKDQKVID